MSTIVHITVRATHQMRVEVSDGDGVIRRAVEAATTRVIAGPGLDGSEVRTTPLGIDVTAIEAFTSGHGDMDK